MPSLLRYFRPKCAERCRRLVRSPSFPQAIFKIAGFFTCMCVILVIIMAKPYLFEPRRVDGHSSVDKSSYHSDADENRRNEHEVGSAIKKSRIARPDVFVVTKVLWNDHGYENCKASFANSLKKLDTGYVDLYLIHTPNGGNILRTYDAMHELKAQGLVRSVGVSNFGIQHLEGLSVAGRPAPSVNQIELHPLYRNQHIVDYCRQHGITVMGYSPLAKGHKMNDDKLTEMATRYKKSVAQLMIRWSVQKGYVTIPKSSKTERVLQNTRVFDWKISPQDMKILDSMPEYSCMRSSDHTGSDWERLK